MHGHGPDDGVIEHCVSTVLVFDAVGSTRSIARVSVDDAGAQLDHILEYAQARVRAAGGTIINYSGDGGVVVFGWPEAVEDHAERACRVACELQDRPDDVDWPKDRDGAPLGLRIGIHSGLVGYRRLMLDLGQRIDTVGATTHLAAALEKTARKGETLVSENTLRLCRRRLPLAPAHAPQALADIGAGAFRLRGLPGDEAPLATRRDNTPFVGREAEATEAMRHFAERGWRDGACAVVGEPGIGKSRIMREILKAIRQEFELTVAVSANATDRTTPFAAANRIMRRLREAIGAPDAAEERTAAAGAARSAAQEFGDLIAGRRVLLALDDLHFIDAESSLFLSNLAEAGGVAMLLAARPEAARAAGRLRAKLIDLEPLSASAMADLAAALVERQKIDPDTAADLVARADGVPFVLEQLVFSLKARGDRQDAALPESIESLIHTRLNGLSAETKSLAQAISVIGRDLDETALSEALGFGDGEMRTAVAELKAFGILNPKAQDYLDFRHAIVAEACATTLPAPRRRRFHEAALDALKLLEPPRHDRLAHHAEGAGDDQEALQHYWSVALTAHQSMASGSIVRIFKQALGCMDRIGVGAEKQLVDFVMVTLPSLVQLGEIDEMQAQLKRIGDLARAQGRADRMCGVLCQEGLLAWFHGDFAAACAVSDEALAIAEEMDSAPMIFAARFNLANGWLARGELARATALGRETLDFVSGRLAGRRLGAVASPEVVANAYLCWFLTETGDFAEAETHGAAAWALAEGLDDPYSEAIAMGNYGRLALLKGDLTAALPRLKMLTTICDANGFDAMYPHAVGLYASALARSDRAEDALDDLERCQYEAYAARTGIAEKVAHQIGEAEVRAALGDRRAARYAIDRAVAVARGVNAPIWLARALGVRDRLGLGQTEDQRERASLLTRHRLVDAC